MRATETGPKYQNLSGLHIFLKRRHQKTDFTNETHGSINVLGQLLSQIRI